MSSGTDLLPWIWDLRVQHESTLLGDLSARVQSLEKQADNVNHSVEQLLSMQMLQLHLTISSSRG